MARPGQRRIQGALFAFLTIFFAGVAWAAFSAEVWVVAVAAVVLALWMGALAARTFRIAREGLHR